MTLNGNTATQNGEMHPTAPCNPLSIDVQPDIDHFIWSGFRGTNFYCLHGRAPAISGGAAAGKMVMEYRESVVKVVCCIQGNTRITVRQSLSSEVSAHGHNLYFVTANTPVVIEWPYQEPQELLIIDLHLDLFTKYFPLHHRTFAALNGSISRQHPVALSDAGLPLSPEISALVFDIIYCKRRDFSKTYYLKAKIIELLLLQAEQRWESDTVYHHQPLRDDEVHRVYQVRDILHNEPAANHTLLSLAHRVGTNDATLKKHFKQVLGTTVFHYLTAHRMQLAKKMLLEENEKVASVAQRVGYKHGTHFTAAFKKYFGYLPTQIKTWLICILWDPIELLWLVI
ncbi:AraC-type DNA-binding protein [Parapedobacter luteus]|uniref:AraC-type DNA-binding protein n=1 Tax=Parapedobacter luteus TaxID=623280 RepID=A0A1T5ALC2_9SPHI|nr:AraC family transcriptional regulator [Parapedobacter luteus]SKB35597.1 AraC-type DNA-binding protein [Parapedobacter luteus]